MLKFVWILEALWGPSCYVMFSTPSKVETWFDYPKNTIVFIKKQLIIYSFDKLLASTKAHCQGC
jgi:hypothetical protein